MATKSAGEQSQEPSIDTMMSMTVVKSLISLLAADDRRVE